MSSGFALLNYRTWRVSKDDPTIWIKPCATLKANVWSSNNIEDSSDPLKNTAQPTYDQVVSSVIDDYNNIQSAYIRLAKYPDDPNNPGTPATGDSTFTIAKGEVRTIDVCFTDPSGVLSGGDASQKADGNNVVGCTIRIKEKYKSDLKYFLTVMTHEIGHCLGLDHPMDTTNAIMSYFRESSPNRLLIDDKMGIIHIYPSDASAAKEKDSLGLSCAKN